MTDCKSMWLCLVGIGAAIILLIALYAGFVIGPNFLVEKPIKSDKTAVLHSSSKNLDALTINKKAGIKV